jgi:site-specific DNA-methyltransferase (cytosine-N4-specific)
MSLVVASISDIEAPHPDRFLGKSLVITGDARQSIAALPVRSVQTVVTSPPYWSLRDYGSPDQIGRDDTLDAYIAALVGVFDEVRDVLTDDGTVWLNLGDAYTSGNRRYRAPDRKNPARAMSVRPPTPDGLKDKDLIGVPWRVALALQAAGWWLRSEVIWNKPNAMPESVTDRPTRSHEHLFLLSKCQDYLYDVDAVTGPNGRRLRDMWDVNTRGYPGAHFAPMPLELAERCVQITSRPGDMVLDPFMGSGTTLVAAQRHGRRFAGIDVNAGYVGLALDRLALSA